MRRPFPPRRAAAAVLLAAAAFLTASCGGDPRFKPVYPVRGEVYVDGKPAAGASVTFHPLEVEEHPWTKPAAEVADDGTFVVSTYRADDGMPRGKYAVTVVLIPKGYAGPLEKGNKLPMRYADKATSGLTAEVAAGDNVLPRIELTR